MCDDATIYNDLPIDRPKLIRNDDTLNIHAHYRSFAHFLITIYRQIEFVEQKMIINFTQSSNFLLAEEKKTRGILFE